MCVRKTSRSPKPAPRSPMPSSGSEPYEIDTPSPPSARGPPIRSTKSKTNERTGSAKKALWARVTKPNSCVRPPSATDRVSIAVQLEDWKRRGGIARAVAERGAARVERDD
eukprot:3934587-Prymnesium_polylepis.1